MLVLATAALAVTNHDTMHGASMAIAGELIVLGTTLLVSKQSTRGSRSVLWGSAVALSATNAVLCGFAINITMREYISGESMLVSACACVVLFLLSITISAIADAECDKMYRFK